MEFEIDIKTNLDGTIVITDYSKEYDQYLDEEVTGFSDSDLKFSESATINSILKVSPGKAELLDVLLDAHKEDLDQSTFKVDEDGYYVVDHFILPNLEWYKNLTDKSYWSTIYVTDGEKIFKEVEGNLEEVSIKEVLERNIEGTTLSKCKIDVFFTGHLQECYINYCKRIYDFYLNKCAPHSYDKDVYARDFIWMTLNIIDYLIGFGQYLEAEAIIREIHGCGGFCNDYKNITKNGSNCGCSKA